MSLYFLFWGVGGRPKSLKKLSRPHAILKLFDPPWVACVLVHTAEGSKLDAAPWMPQAVGSVYSPRATTGLRLVVSPNFNFSLKRSARPGGTLRSRHDFLRTWTISDQYATFVEVRITMTVPPRSLLVHSVSALCARIRLIYINIGISRRMGHISSGCLTLELYVVPQCTEVCRGRPVLAHLFALSAFDSWISACSASRPQNERSRLFSIPRLVDASTVKDPHSFSPQSQPRLFWWMGSSLSDQKKSSGLIVSKRRSALPRFPLWQQNGCSPKSWIVLVNASFST